MLIKRLHEGQLLIVAVSLSARFLSYLPLLEVSTIRQNTVNYSYDCRSELAGLVNMVSHVEFLSSYEKKT